MFKALDVTIRYGDQESKFSIYTDDIRINLLEIVHQSYLPSSGLLIKVFIGNEYIPKSVGGMLRAGIDTVRDELREQVRSMTSSPMVVSSLEQGITTAQEWFGN